MLSIKAENREESGKKTRQQGFLPAVLYGQGIKGLPIKISKKEFENIFKQAGTSSLISLELDGKKHEVLIYDSFRDPLTEELMHVDFFKPSTKREITAEVPLVFEGEAPAVKNLGGNLLKEVQSIEVKGFAHSLPKEVKVDVSVLKSFDDKIQVKDLAFPEGVSALKDGEDIVALVIPPREEEEEPTKEEAPEEENQNEEENEEEK